jgi:hypothetical protein
MNAEVATLLRDGPSGFAAYVEADGTLQERHVTALRRLVNGPTAADVAAHDDVASRNRGDLVRPFLGRDAHRLWTHEASMGEWRTAVAEHLDSLAELKRRGIPTLDGLKRSTLLPHQASLRGTPGEIVRIPMRNALMQDLLVMQANEHARLEATGFSRVYGVAPPSQLAGKRMPLDMRRFADTPELLTHLRGVHGRMVEEAAAGGTPAPERQRVTFALGNLLHVTGAEIRTTMHEGRPVSALVCVDGSSASEVAFELKALLDRDGPRDVAALVVNAQTQYSISDCPIYALFHAGKLRRLAEDGRLDALMDKLLQGPVNDASYRLPWGDGNGAQVHFIEDDNQPASRLLPPELLKETQSTAGLERLVAARGWQETPVNKKGQAALDRYQDSHEGGRSTLMTDKAEKYFTRAAQALDELELRYGSQGGEAMLKRLLDEAHGPDMPPEPGERAAVIELQIRQCEANIAALAADERRRALSHDRCLIEQVLDGEPSEEADPSCRERMEALERMSDDELEALDGRQERLERAASAEADHALAHARCGPGFLGACERLQASSDTERERLASLHGQLAA